MKRSRRAVTTTLLALSAAGLATAGLSSSDSNPTAGEVPSQASAPVQRASPLAQGPAPAALASATAAAAHASAPERTALLAALERSAGPGLVARVAPETGAVRFLQAPPGRVLEASDGATALAPARARSFLGRYGAVLGLSAAEAEAAARGAAPASGSTLVQTRAEDDALGQTHVRFRQEYRGLPVLGGELVVHLDAAGVTGVSGTFVPDVAVGDAPALSRAEAEALARADGGDAAARVKQAHLAVHRSGLLQGVEGESRLAWVAELEGAHAHTQVWLDAQEGRVLERIPLRHGALNRVVYTPQYDPANPDLFVARKEGGGPSLLPQVNNLFDFAGQTYNLFASAVGRDSYDGAGRTMRSVYLVNENCPNAYWDGQSTNYCPGFDLDDVVSHEWAHAYTEYTHGLIYAYQSGALNESYSDIWGEAMDLLNGRDGLGGSNNAQPAPAGQRWMIGEDLPVVVDLLFRDMWDPERLGYPSKVSSANYYCSSGDGGGVHTNSGVPNHAFAMLVDGKTFNGQTVSGLGLTKALAIYWRAQSVYQTESSNFPAHADALEASCRDLTGQPLTRLSTTSPAAVLAPDVITPGDCAQVSKAIAAVELRQAPTQCGFVPQLKPNPPAKCAGASTLYREDWEGGLGGWALSKASATTEPARFDWTVRGALPGGRAGQAAFAVNDRGGTCAPGGDHSSTYALTSPTLTASADLQVRFDHFVETEQGYDGGNLLLSVNGGAWTVVPLSAYLFNGPERVLEDPAPLGNNTNPKAGQIAWTGADGGDTRGSWGTTVLALGGLVQPGDTYQLRFEFGVDGCNGVTGWFVDTVEAYQCTGQATLPPTARFAATPSPAVRGQDVTFDGAASSDNDALNADPGVVNYTWDFGDGATASGSAATVRHVYAAAGTYTVTLTVTDNEGETGSTSQALQVDAPVQQLPDLVVSDLSTAAIRHGATVRVTVSNTGTAAAPATRTAVRVDSRTLATLDTPALAAGASAVVTVDWDVRGQAGAHDLSATADAAGAVAELVEDNNTATRAVTVQGNRVK